MRNTLGLICVLAVGCAGADEGSSSSATSTAASTTATVRPPRRLRPARRRGPAPRPRPRPPRMAAPRLGSTAASGTGGDVDRDRLDRHRLLRVGDGLLLREHLDRLQHDDGLLRQLHLVRGSNEHRHLGLDDAGRVEQRDLGHELVQRHGDRIERVSGTTGSSASFSTSGSTGCSPGGSSVDLDRLHRYSIRKCTAFSNDCGGHNEQVQCSGRACVCTVDRTVSQTAVSTQADPCTDAWQPVLRGRLEEPGARRAPAADPVDRAAISTARRPAPTPTTTRARVCFVFCTSANSRNRRQLHPRADRSGRGHVHGARHPDRPLCGRRHVHPRHRPAGRAISSTSTIRR